MTARRVVIVGGGITGLTLAYRLLSASPDKRPDVTVLEAKPRLGGNIQTERQAGFVIDGGPDSFVATKPFATELCKELGLGDRLIGTTARNRRVYVPRDGALHKLPEGLVLAVPTRFLPFATSGLFSMRGKARMGLDVVIPRRAEQGEDESIGSFIRRRLGEEALSTLAEPLLGGIYAGDVDRLSLRSTFPQLLDLEAKHGSLIRGALAERKNRPSSGKAAPSPFHSLLGGMGELVDALVRKIEAAGGDIRIGAPVVSIDKPGDAASPTEPAARYRVGFSGPLGGVEVIRADDVVIACPAHAAAGALAKLDPEIEGLLRGIPYLSTATVVFAFSRASVSHPLDAVGVVIPKEEGRRILAATFISSKWVARAPTDAVLMRVFVGGFRDPGALELSDAELISLGRKELAALIGVRAEPLLGRVFRYENANAQPVIGHAERVKQIRALASRHPGLRFAGAAFDGVGIPDCVRQANEAARAILAS